MTETVNLEQTLIETVRAASQIPQGSLPQSQKEAVLSFARSPW
jgi:hypothetical protein